MNRFAQQRQAGRAADQKAVAGFWAKADKYNAEKVEAATVILATPDSIKKHGGEGAAVVAWARLTLRNDAERKAAR